MNKKLWILCVVILLVGCEKVSPDVTPYTIPLVESLSGTEYESYRYQFSPVATAVYRANGTEEVINSDDVRLVRLLNLLAYSHSENLQKY